MNTFSLKTTTVLPFQWFVIRNTPWALAPDQLHTPELFADTTSRTFIHNKLTFLSRLFSGLFTVYDSHSTDHFVGRKGQVFRIAAGGSEESEVPAES